MGNVREITGNIFASQCQTLVNAVNCVGVMGAGIALEFRLRSPEMYQQYLQHCQKGEIKTGKLWLYEPPSDARDGRWVLNFPTKEHWREPSRLSYLEMGLAKFTGRYRQRGIESIAFPILGAGRGGISEEVSLKIMHQYLVKCDIPVEIYHYDPSAEDDLYQEFREKVRLLNREDLAKQTGITQSRLAKVLDLLGDTNINSLSQLGTVKGIGSDTLEKCFLYAMSDDGVGAPASLPLDY